jgi:hypothetical protein
MDVYLYRHFTGTDHLDQVPAESWSTNGLFTPREEDGELKFPIAACGMMQDFYLRHGLAVTHWLAVQRGWTVEYVHVDLSGDMVCCPFAGGDSCRRWTWTCPVTPGVTMCGKGVGDGVRNLSQSLSKENQGHAFSFPGGGGGRRRAA